MINIFVLIRNCIFSIMDEIKEDKNDVVWYMGEDKLDIGDTTK